MSIAQVIADKVERHTLKCLPATTGYFSCEFCTCPGRGLSGGWPYPYSVGYPLRNHGSFARISREIRHQEPSEIHRRTTQGILGYSPLLDIPGFNIVEDVPLDEFHLIREGITKFMMMRMFKQSTTPEAVRLYRRINRVYITTQVFSQCSRRTRTLARLPDFKGNFRDLTRNLTRI